MPGERQPAARGDVVDVVPRPLPPRTGLAVSRDRAINDPGVVGSERVVIDAEPLRHAGAEAFERNIRFLRELPHDELRFGRLEVDRDRALVAVLGAELHWHIAAPRVAVDRFDLDHFRAEVGKDRRAERAGNEHREVDDVDAV